MNKLSLGGLAIILGGLLLSAELYGIKIIQGLDSQPWADEDVFEYVKEAPVSIAILITVAIICYGIWLSYKGYVECKNNK